MTWVTGALATCRFELQRSFTFQRTAVSILLSLFPPTMLTLVIFGSRAARNQERVAGVVSEATPLLTILMVSLVCLLSLLLWATPNVHSELEGKSWSFVACRPGGRISIFIGKFLASFIVAFCISVLSITLCILISNRTLSLPDPQKLWIAMVGVYLFACAVYAAVFSMLGTIFIKRAMVVGAGYLIGSDIFLASLPGTLVNKFTLRYHLQELGINWIGWFMPGSAEEEYRMIYGEAWPVWIHILALIGIVAVTLFVGSRVIVSREYVTKDES